MSPTLKERGEGKRESSLTQFNLTRDQGMDASVCQTILNLFPLSELEIGTRVIKESFDRSLKYLVIMYFSPSPSSGLVV